ncbi:NAD-dependent epimerase/dehydratase family protein [Parafilimonas sp.]|uniref:NAD-dependent epimerase/dehydratase family protein n=1 Tax=Parafilimonas sp. TaxID=1969739 RepID=UPI0039E5BBDF
MNILVTGAGGFIGSRLVEMAQPEFGVKTLSLRNKEISTPDLNGADVIIHLAGKAHEMKKINEQAYYDINYTLTKKLADKAVQKHIPHFIYISTLKVYGDETDIILNENSPCQPTDAYGKSKLQAEEYLQSLQPEIKVAIVRPPLVYGAGVKGNMLRMLNLCSKNIPLPFAKAGNKRSMVFIDNLIELIFAICRQQKAGVFLPADDKALSTDELLAYMQKAFKNNTSLVSLPPGLRYLLKKIRPALYKRLFQSLVVDNVQTNNMLNFIPPYHPKEGIATMVNWYKRLHKL